MKLIVEQSIACANAQISAGADTINIGDSASRAAWIYMTD